MSALIHVRDLTFSYNKGKESRVDAIKHLSFEIEKGDFVGIIGVSESGKSTLLYLLAGLLKPNSGEYYYGNVNMVKISNNRAADLRNSDFGFILQDFGLEGNCTALENVCLPLMFS
jgi:putative ABC transport system ATP-binding protein